MSSANSEAKTKYHFRRIFTVFFSVIMLSTCLSMIVSENTEAAWIEYSVNSPYANGQFACTTNPFTLSNQATTALREDDGILDTYTDSTTHGYMFGTYWYSDSDDPTYQPQYSEESWPLTSDQIANLTITQVKILLIGRVINPHDFIPGHFIFLNNYTLDAGYPRSNTWLPNATEGGWSSSFNTSEIAEYDETGTYDFLVTRDITEAYEEWDYYDLFSGDTTGFRCWWWTNVSTTPQYWDYIGITFRYSYGIDYALGEEINVIANTYGLIWLMVIFVPAIAIGIIVPKIGVMIGLGLMTIGIGLIYTSFLPVTMVGIIGVGIYIYKGED